MAEVNSIMIYFVRTFVNVTMYPQYNNDIIKKISKHTQNPLYFLKDGLGCLNEATNVFYTYS
jgi:hypothetical protein